MLYLLTRPPIPRQAFLFLSLDSLPLAGLSNNFIVVLCGIPGSATPLKHFLCHWRPCSTDVLGILLETDHHPVSSIRNQVQEDADQRTCLTFVQRSYHFLLIACRNQLCGHVLDVLLNIPENNTITQWELFVTKVVFWRLTIIQSALFVTKSRKDAEQRTCWAFLRRKLPFPKRLSQSVYVDTYSTFLLNTPENNTITQWELFVTKVSKRCGR